MNIFGAYKFQFSAISFSTISGVLIPSASALKLVISRCLRTGRVTFFISSISGVYLPYKIAFVLAPRIRYCEALGPAPQLSQSFM